MASYSYLLKFSVSETIASYKQVQAKILILKT